jgi:hypothetical protein
MMEAFALKQLLSATKNKSSFVLVMIKKERLRISRSLFVFLEKEPSGENA